MINSSKCTRTQFSELFKIFILYYLQQAFGGVIKRTKRKAGTPNQVKGSPKIKVS